VAREQAAQRAMATSRIELRREVPTRIQYLARPIAGPSLSGFLARFEITELPPPGRSATSKANAILGIGRGRWWLVEDELAQSGDSSPIAMASFDIAVDISDAWERFRICGQGTLDLLSKGSALDLDQRVFAKGNCALASFAQLHTLLYRAPDGKHFDLYCGRSYAQSLEEWLAEAAAEFAWEEPPERGGAAGKARN
jgi:heterotetrameric sarcosine oxidase gamma subunit